MNELPEILRGEASSITDVARRLGQWLHNHGERRNSAELAEAFCRADKALERLVMARAEAFSAAGQQAGENLWCRTETKVLLHTCYDWRGAVPLAWRHENEMKALRAMPSRRKDLVDDAWTELTQLRFLVHRIALRHGLRLVGRNNTFSFIRSVEWN